MINYMSLESFMRKFGIKYFALSALLVAAAGCGNGLAKVSGNITLDGSPLGSSDKVRTKVLFFPEVGTGAPAIGLVDEDGSYELYTGSNRGVQPGSYLVTVSATEIIPPKTEGGLPDGRRLTPSKYANPKTSGLRERVESGSNSFDFELVPEPRRSSRVSRRR